MVASVMALTCCLALQIVRFCRMSLGLPVHFELAEHLTGPLHTNWQPLR